MCVKANLRVMNFCLVHYGPCGLGLLRMFSCVPHEGFFALYVPFQCSSQTHALLWHGLCRDVCMAQVQVFMFARAIFVLDPSNLLSCFLALMASGLPFSNMVWWWFAFQAWPHLAWLFIPSPKETIVFSSLEEQVRTVVTCPFPDPPRQTSPPTSLVWRA